MEILTVAEVALMLKVSERHVYEMTKPNTVSGDVRENPIPCLRIGTAVRFRKSDVEAWIEKMVKGN